MKLWVEGFDELKNLVGKEPVALSELRVKDLVDSTISRQRIWWVGLKLWVEQLVSFHFHDWNLVGSTEIAGCSLGGCI